MGQRAMSKFWALLGGGGGGVYNVKALGATWIEGGSKLKCVCSHKAKAARG